MWYPKDTRKVSKYLKDQLVPGDGNEADWIKVMNKVDVLSYHGMLFFYSPNL